MPTKPRNGFVNTLGLFVLALLVSILGYVFVGLADEQDKTAEVAISNKTELARRESMIAKIPIIDKAVQEIQVEQAVQGQVLKAIARKVGAD